jgi:hypothetical protein
LGAGVEEMKDPANTASSAPTEAQVRAPILIINGSTHYPPPSIIDVYVKKLRAGSR